MDYQTADDIRREILASGPPEVTAMILGQRFSDDPEFYAALHGREIAPGVHIQNPGPDPARMTERLLRKVQGASQDYVTGMQNPRRDPKAAALRAAGKFADKIQAAIRDKRYEAGIRNYDQAEAVQIATSDGGSAYAQGVAKRAAKIARVHQRLAPLLGGVSSAIQAMPQDTDGQREARLIAARRAMINVGKQLKGGGGA